MEKAYIVLSDGQVFEGSRFGAQGDTVGELVFTTGMVGYTETLTDPSYCGLIVIQTFPLIGNYGVMSADMESGGVAAKAYVVREWCENPSNFRAEMNIDAFLKSQGVIGICGVDTRQLTRIIREHGVINAKIVSELTPDMLEGVAEYRVNGAVERMSVEQMQVHPAQGEERFHVAMLDYGTKRSIVTELTKRGCRVSMLPYNTSAEAVLALNADGLMLSSGPGDPRDNVACIEQLKKLLGKLPIFGICLGHQLLALAAGGDTVKLKYGHRGANQPVKQLSTGKVYISTQSHGYAVVSDSLDAARAKESFVNANDGTCEGIEYPRDNAFTVQFHPEACAGPKDTGFLFDEFLKRMGDTQHA